MVNSSAVGQNLYASSIFHKSFVHVNEELKPTLHLLVWLH
jgi:hypothetical protein